MSKPRYRFAGFVLSPARRTLSREGREIPLIPRYFDLLMLLLERRGQAVSRREILETVWSDVVVSDGALSQAVRTLRRALGDDVREARFIRTRSRHGYQFVHADVVEEPDEAAPPPTAPGADPAQEASAAEGGDPLDEAIGRLLGAPEEDDRREAAERIHQLGTAEALRRLDRRPGHAEARALLRDARWDVPAPGAVPLLGQPGGFEAARVLIALRLRSAARQAGNRWASATWGGAASGICAGLLGALALWLAPGSTAHASLLPVLAAIGGAIGGAGAAGVGAGLAAAEALARGRRGAALVLGGALGGGAVGMSAHLIGSWTVENLFGHELTAVGGGLEGIVIGAAAGVGYAMSTPRPGGGGMAAPRGSARLWAAAVTGWCCAVACLLLAWGGGHLGGVSVDAIARSFQGSHAGLAPLARLLGEGRVGPLTRGLLSVSEGLFFGFGLVLGLTRRPRIGPDS